MGLFNRKPKTDYRPCGLDGFKFRNEKVRDRYLFLKRLQNQGVISDLKVKPRFTIVPVLYGEIPEGKRKPVKLQRAYYYYGDFSYLKNGNLVVEDVKNKEGHLTSIYKLKKRLMMYFHQIDVQEIYDATSWVNDSKKPR